MARPSRPYAWIYCGTNSKVFILIAFVLHLLTGAFCAISVQRSSHSCSGSDPNTRLCRFSNLVVTDGKILYISDKAVDLPKMAGYRPGYAAYGPPVEVVDLQTAQAALEKADELKTLPYSALVFRMHYENWGHHVLDITATTHRVMCATLKLCSYDGAALQKFTLVFFDDFPKHTGNFQRIWGCYSGNGPVYVKKPEFRSKAYILQDAAAGWSFLSLFDPGWSREDAKGYYERVWKCMGLDMSSTVHDINPMRVTFIQRPFYESKKARSFVNIYDLVPLLQERHKNIQFAVQTLGNKDFNQVVSIFHNSSIVFAVNGAAMGNAIFMRKGSVYVDVGPIEWHWGFITWTFNNLQDSAKVKVLRYSVSEPQLKPLRWEQIARDAKFQSLPAEQLVKLVENHACPKAIEGYCKADWLYTKTDFVLTLHAAEHWLDVASDHIKSFKS